jgi:hypothetical protein
MGTKKAAAAREISDVELEGAVRALVQAEGSVGRTEFKKKLGPEYKKLEARALDLARGLAGRREIHRWASGATKEWFFVADPYETLSQVVRGALADGPLDDVALKGRVVARGKGFGDLLPGWLKGALARGELFSYKAKAGSKKQLALEPPRPDISAVLKTVFTALDKALVKTDAARVPREAVLAALADRLGLAVPAVSEPGNPKATPPDVLLETERSSFIRALRQLSAENVASGLLPVRDLRAQLRLEKPRFDRLALELFREELITLHHHDFPTSLSPSERQEMVEDERGTHYNGIALRRSHG